MAALPAVAMIASMAATGLQVMGTLQQGRAQQAALNYEASEHERQAAEERAASQREAITKRTDAERVMSRQRALASASGAGVVNPSILDIYGETAQQGEYNAQTALYGGENRARGQLSQANANRFKAKAAYKGSLLEAGGQAFAGIGKAFGAPAPSNQGFGYS
jgi:hypothetical protein